MSGGVDSSVTAALLLEQGYEVIGLTMNHWDDNSGPNSAVAEAEKIAVTLDIPFHVVNFKSDFRRLVIDPFGREYFDGCTPNPCIICNKKIKFGLLL
ncbi:MAG: 7-cyano-7-deazaguanine synthase, partial [Desulfuromonadales bacterium]|nr:7-cyano-7-deazaguanine synthase [Desulfuromonadales bacterium]